PTFSLEIAEFNSRRVSIGGAVAQPGVLPVGLQPLLLGDAIASVGSVTAPDLDFATVRLYRDGTLYQIPVTTLYERSDLLSTRLVDGDAIFVDVGYELDQAQAYFQQEITLVQTRQQARAAALDELNVEVSLRRGELNEARANYQLREQLGADNRDYVYLVGELDTQTRFALPFERTASLADAVFDTAGGLAGSTGDVSQLYVLRASNDPRDFGAITAWQLDARNAANFALMTDFELRPDDVIFVAQQPITRWNRAISQLLPSIFSAVNVATN
ncbi:MAG: sugar transporter, partial [Pseudomonadota bacterium]